MVKEEKLQKIIDYVKVEYDNLPKSKFDKDKCIIIYVKEDSAEGWGHHNFEGLGVEKDGKLKWFFSSGCSCSGGPWSEDATLKKIEVKKSPYDALFDYWGDFFKTGKHPEIEEHNYEEY